MTAVQTSIAEAGLALQSAKGAPATDPQYQYGLKSGQVAKVEITQDADDLTSGSRVASHVNRTAALPMVDYSTRAWKDQIGLMLYGALGGYAVTGAGPYAHVFTPAGDVPYLTAWGLQDGNNYRTDDCKIDELKLSWSGNDPLEVGLSLKGLDVTPGVADPTPDADVTCDAYLKPTGGTFLVDVEGATPAAAKVLSGEITVANGLVQQIVSGVITPDDVDVARLVLSVSLTLRADDVTAWRETVFGSAAGTDISDDVVTGSFDVTFTDGTNTLQITGDNVPFLCDLPDVNPSGGPGQIVLAGQMLQCGTDPIEFTLTNSVVDYTA